MAEHTEPTFVSVSDKFNCSICTKVYDHPMLTDCCGQNFCNHCLEKWFKRERSCPHCRKVDFNHIQNLPLQREIAELDVHCSNRAHGCDKVIPYNALTKHLETCDFSIVPCTNKCGDTLLRKDLQQHQQQACLNREIDCHLCGERGMYKDITTSHQANCPDVSFDCPRGCGAARIKRKNLPVHKQKCPLEPVKCPFFEAGCKDMLFRKDLDAHTASSTQEHLQMVMVTSTKNKAENRVLKQKFNNLVSCVTFELDSMMQHLQVGGQEGLHCIKTAMISATTMLGQGQHCLHFFWGSDTSLRTPSFYLKPGYKVYLTCDREYDQQIPSNTPYVKKEKVKKQQSRTHREFYTFYVEKGEYDDHLPWPIQKIEVEINVRRGEELLYFVESASKSFIFLLCDKCCPELTLGPVGTRDQVRPIVDWQENGRYLKRPQNPNGFYANIILKEHECTPHM